MTTSPRAWPTARALELKATLRRLGVESPKTFGQPVTATLERTHVKVMLRCEHCHQPKLLSHTLVRGRQHRRPSLACQASQRTRGDPGRVHDSIKGTPPPSDVIEERVRTSTRSPSTSTL